MSPPSLTFGQETLISNALITSSSFKILTHSTYSSTVPAAILQIKGTSYCLRKGILSFIKASTPTLARPIAFNIPAGVSTILCGGLPLRGFKLSDFVTIPPRLLRSVNSEISFPYPTVPEASITGFFNSSDPIFTDRSTLLISQHR